MATAEQKAERRPLLKTWPRTNVNDLTRKRYGRLRAVAPTDDRGANGAVVWRCACRCGTENVLVLSTNLTSGNTTSCGCYQADRTRQAHPSRKER
jgi:hypothetical protein